MAAILANTFLTAPACLKPSFMTRRSVCTRQEYYSLTLSSNVLSYSTVEKTETSGATSSNSGRERVSVYFHDCQTNFASTYWTRDWSRHRPCLLFGVRGIDAVMSTFTFHCGLSYSSLMYFLFYNFLCSTDAYMNKWMLITIDYVLSHFLHNNYILTGLGIQISGSWRSTHTQTIRSLETALYHFASLWQPCLCAILWEETRNTRGYSKRWVLIFKSSFQLFIFFSVTI